MLRNFLLVGLGGAVGSMLRYAATLLVAHLSMPATLSTFCVNCVGSFLLGFLGASLTKESLLICLTVGLCGGFTTYSTFSSQSLQLLQSGKYSSAFLYILCTLVLCLLCSWLGVSLGSKQ